MEAIWGSCQDYFGLLDNFGTILDYSKLLGNTLETLPHYLETDWGLFGDCSKLFGDYLGTILVYLETIRIIWELFANTRHYLVLGDDL